MEMVKQEMARVTINILGISELKWTGIGEFNSDEYYIYYWGQKSLIRNGVTLCRQKSRKCSTWVQPQKWENDLRSFPTQAIQHHSNSSLCRYHQCWGDQFYKYVQNRLELTPKKRCPFYHRALQCKSRKSRDTWSSRQVWP